jgi:exonuclease SbcC
MRPELLEVSGFTAFRDPTSVDFRDADLFALTGPTGSGKSSLIDAIVFSLYGSVPRIGQRDVAPIISLGKLEARVRFEFSLNGVHYTVARVVRRTKSGASTAEARLERDGEVLAGNADEVTEHVGRLLGLGFEHFTKSVVLPQGQFAAFLHDRPADRQRLLRELLDLVVYESMRDLAKQRRIAAETRVKVLQTQLEELTHATPEAEQQALELLERLETIREEVEAAEPELRTIRDRIDKMQKSAESSTASIKLVERIKVPDDVGGLTDRLDAARRTAGELDDASLAADERLKKAEDALQALPARAELDLLLAQHEALAEERRLVVKVQERLATIEKESDQLRARLEASGKSVIAARDNLEETQRNHAAHALAATLTTGEECPVCHQLVEELPASEVRPELGEAEAALAAAVKAEDEVRAAERSEAGRLATEQTRLADAEARIERLERELEDALDLESARQAKESLEVADSDLQKARVDAEQATEAARTARKEIAALESQTTAAWRRFDQIRDGVAALGPPLPARENLAVDWVQLAEWARESVGKLQDEVEAVSQAVETLRLDLREREEAVRSKVEREGLDVERRPIRDVVVAAVTAANHQLTSLRRDLARVEEHKTKLAADTEEAELAKALGRHLSATGFEAWLMEEALTALVTGANILLDHLAAGAYSLEMVKRDFRVIDHRNAGERRQVKTLSGGETFLVSLALALSLAEQLASMSVHGGSRLESVFLDEGFGTLDIETLDTVAHVIQELGARGRTVGIVTHVRDLAEQVPVRFEVRKGAGTATVDRVEL